MEEICANNVWKEFRKRYSKVDSSLIDTLESWYDAEFAEFEEFDTIDDAIDYILDDIPAMYDASCQDSIAKKILTTFCPMYADLFDDE